MSLIEEIRQQPAVIQDALSANAAHIDRVADDLDADGFDYVMIAARGTSDNAARYAQYVLGVRNRLPVALAAPSLFGRYHSAPDLRRALVVGLSQSGASPDLVEVLAEARRQQRPTLAITNRADSPLAAVGDEVIELRAGEEKAVAATKTYTTELLAIAMLSSALAGDGAAHPALASVPGAMTEVLLLNDELAEAAQQVADAERLVVVGRGFHQATAFEWALKMQELTYVLAHPYAEPDFRHGPQAVVERDFPVLMAASDGPVLEGMIDLSRDVIGQGATVIAVTDQRNFPATSAIAIPSAPEWVSPLVAAAAIQLFAFHLANAKGIDPDQPRHISKVTRTH
ncbi:MAG TPA: SIS domain-containing protein [Acidimicrobiia bacterium]|nr:SIS domain-containing protein [Acidimicrobiia bacterium]